MPHYPDFLERTNGIMNLEQYSIVEVGNKRKKVTRSFFLLLIFFLFSFLTSLYADTFIPGGSITQNTTWTLAGSPYILQGTVTVRSAATLTVQPGVIVKANPGLNIQLKIGQGTSQGSLIAVGTQSQPIRFTSNSITPQPSQWSGIVFDDGTNDQTAILDYCMIEYGNPNVSVLSSSPTIRHSTLQQSGGSGLFAQGGTPLVELNSFQNNVGDAISALSFREVQNFQSTNTFQGNNTNGVFLLATNVNYDATVSNPGAPYFTRTNIVISNTPQTASTLTVQPGVTIRFKAGFSLKLQVGSGASRGALIAQGTQVSPIRFTSDDPVQNSGQWQGIFFDDGTVDQTTILDHCIVEFGQNGISATNSLPTIQNSVIQQNNLNAILLNTGGAPYFNSNNILNNPGRIISAISPLETRNVNSNNTFQNNGINIIEWTNSGTTYVNTDTIIRNLGFPYLADGNIEINSFNSPPYPTVTIEPGVEIRFHSGQNLTFGISQQGYAGKLIAQGTAANPIRFISDASTPAPGNWQGLRLGPGTQSGTILDHVIVEYGGNPGVSMDAFSSVINMTNSEIRYSSGHGVRFSGNGTFQSNTIQNNNGGLEVTTGNSQVLGNLIQNNGTGPALNALNVTATSGSTTISNNIFTNHTGNSIVISSTATPIISGNTFSNNQGKAIVATSIVQLTNLNNTNTFTNVGIPVIDLTGTGTAYISSNMTLYNWGFPYLVSSSTEINSFNSPPYPTVTIEPGVEIRFHSGQNLTFGTSQQGYSGKLIAQGTAANPIRFTSDAATPAPGNWQGLRLGPGTQSGTILDHVIVEYAGAQALYSNSPNDITITNSSFRNSQAGGVTFSGIGNFQNNTIENSGTYGLEVATSTGQQITNNTVRNNGGNGLTLTGGGNSVIQNNTFQNNNGIALNITATSGAPQILNNVFSTHTSHSLVISSNAIPVISGNTFSNNQGKAILGNTLAQLQGLSNTNTFTNVGIPVIELTGTGTAYISSNMTLYNWGFPYLVSSSTEINSFNSPPYPTVTIEPGVEIRFHAGQNLTFGTSQQGYSGKLIAQGTTQNPIRFTPDSQTPAAGQWSGLRLELGTQSGTILDHVIVEYAGSPGLRLNSTNAININNSTIQYSSGSGFEILSSTSQFYFQNNLVQNNNGHALNITATTGGSYILNNTFQNNMGDSIAIVSTSYPTISGNVFDHNQGRAISAYGVAQLFSVTNTNTFTNVGNPIVELTSTNSTLVNASMTLYNFGFPYIVRGNIEVGSYGQPYPTLTIQPGVELRFAPNTFLRVGYYNQYGFGSLAVQGTQQNPVRFTSNSPTPAPGDWQGLKFESGNLVYQSIEHLIVEYAGDPGIAVNSTFADIRNSIVRFNSGDGIKTIGTAQTHFLNNSFLQNGLKGVNHTASGNAFAYMNWWGSASEPANQVAGNVRYDPWLTTPPSDPFQWTEFNLSSRQFHAGSGSTNFQFLHPQPANWTLEVLNSDLSQVLRTLVGQNQSPTLIEWDGNNQAGQPLQNGTYKFRFNGTSQANGQQAAAVLGNVQVNNSLPIARITQPIAYQIIPGYTNLAINGTAQASNFLNYTVERYDTFSGGNFIQLNSSTTQVPSGLLANWDVGNLTSPVWSTIKLTVRDNANQSAIVEIPVGVFNIFGITHSQNYISPNGDGVQDNSIITARSTLNANWILQIKNAGNQVVRTVNQPNQSLFSFNWDGTGNGGTLLPDGSYTYQISASESGSGVSVPVQPGSSPIVLDATFPEANISNPTIGQSVFGTSFQIRGTASDNNIQSYIVAYATAQDPANYQNIDSGGSNVTNGLLATWSNLQTLSNGGYSIRLQVTDRAGNQSTVLVPLVLDNIEITNVNRTPDHIDHRANETVSISYTIDRDALMSVKIYSELTNALIKTLINRAPRSEGDRSEIWDGRNDTGQQVPYEAYYIGIDAESQANDGRIDQFVDIMGGSPSFQNYTIENGNFDPYRNQRYLLHYTVPNPGRQSFFVRNTATGTIIRTLVGTEPKLAGNRTEAWDGRTDAGQIFTGSYNIAWGGATSLRQRTIILQRALSAPTNFSSEAYLIIPVQSEISNLRYSLSSDARITVTVNDPNGNHFKTLVNNEIESAGDHTLVWDGRNDVGEFGATEGSYRVHVSATHPISGDSVESIGLVTVYE